MSFYTYVSFFKRKVFYRGWDDRLGSITRQFSYRPKLYVPCEETDPEVSEFRSLLTDLPLRQKDFSTPKEMREYVEQMSQIQGSKIYGTTSIAAQIVQSKFPGEIKFDMDKIHVVTYDIEVESEGGFPDPFLAEQEVLSISLYSSKYKEYFVWGKEPFDSSKTTVKGKVNYTQVSDERRLLFEFLVWWRSNYPDILTGWYTRSFDSPYLFNRITKLFGDDMAQHMSPFNHVRKREKVDHKTGNMTTVYDFHGISELDYLELFQKFTLNTLGQQESYTLDFIGNLVLGEGKVSYETYNLTELYRSDYQTFINYNLRDVEIVVDLDKALDLIFLALTITYRAGVNPTSAMGTTTVWGTLMYRDLHDKKLLPEVLVKDLSKRKDHYSGGYVKEPQIGHHGWCMSFDAASLYPNTIVQYNMSPETVVHDVTHEFRFDSETLNFDVMMNVKKDPEFTYAANGLMFRKIPNAIFPYHVKKLYSERKEIKKRMIRLEKEMEQMRIEGKVVDEKMESEAKILNNRQTMIKILLNSLYGALANEHFDFFNKKIAEAITVSGQMAIKWCEKKINERISSLTGKKKDYIIAMDTDSTIVDCSWMESLYAADSVRSDPNSPKYMSKIDYMHFLGEKFFGPILRSAADELFEMTGGYENRLEMKREVISDAAVWLTKKKYFMRVLDKEGIRYDHPHLKVVGVDAVRSSTPKVCREKFKELYGVIVDGDEDKTREFISNFYDEWQAMPISAISFPRGVSNVTKWEIHPEEEQQPRRKSGLLDLLSLGTKVPLWEKLRGSYRKGTPIQARAAILYNLLLDHYNVSSKYPRITNGSKIKYTYLKTPNPIGENVIAFATELPAEFGLDKYVDRETQFKKSFLNHITSIFEAIGWTGKKNFFNHQSQESLAL